MKRVGPGTELKDMFSLILLDATPDCLCHGRAMLMDQMGVRWCCNNLDTIVDWLEDEAELRKMVFDREAARRIVLIAIKRGSTKSARLRIPKPGITADQPRVLDMLWKYTRRTALYIAGPGIRVLYSWKGLPRFLAWCRNSWRRAKENLGRQL